MKEVKNYGIRTPANLKRILLLLLLCSIKLLWRYRTLPLVGSFAEYFKEVKAAQEVNKKVCGNCYNYEYDGYVFVDELGNLMNPNYLTSYFSQYIQKHGCKRMRFHDLRHSCASLLLANGVPLKHIQEWLGPLPLTFAPTLTTRQSCHRQVQW